MRIRSLLVALAALGATGCVQYGLNADDVLNTDEQLNRQGLKLAPGLPVAQAPLGPGFRVVSETVPTPYGGLALTRAESDPGRPLIVFCGGNLFRQGTRGAATLQALAPLGDVWIFDYPGYGGAPGQGRPAEFLALRGALSRRVDAAFEPGGRTGDLVFMGHSFGGGVCAGLASRVGRPSHLVLVGAFRDFASVVNARAGVFRPLVRPVIAADVPDTDIVDVLGEYRGSVTAVGVLGDEVVPFSATRELERALRRQGRPTKLVGLAGADHVGVLNRPDFRAAVRGAFEAFGIGRDQPPPPSSG